MSHLQRSRVYIRDIRETSNLFLTTVGDSQSHIAVGHWSTSMNEGPSWNSQRSITPVVCESEGISDDASSEAVGVRPVPYRWDACPDVRNK
jgi:hypothetical protein